MTAPRIPLAALYRHRMRDLKWERSGAVPPGRVMLCRGRKVTGFCDVDALGAQPYSIAQRADTVCVAAADFDDVMAWLKKEKAA